MSWWLFFCVCVKILKTFKTEETWVFDEYEFKIRKQIKKSREKFIGFYFWIRIH